MCCIAGSIDIILDASGHDDNIMRILNVFTRDLQGLVNFIFFIRTEEVKLIVKHQLCSMMPCFYSRKNLYKQRLHDEANESKNDSTEVHGKRIKNHELVDF